MNAAHSFLTWCIVVMVLAGGLEAQEAGTKVAPSAGSRNPKKWVSGVAVRVNHAVITKAQVWEEVGGGRLATASQAQRKRLYDSTLDGLIMQTISDQAAARAGLTLSEFETRRHIEDEKERLGGEEAYYNMLNERGQSEDDFVDEFMKNMRRTHHMGSLAGRYQALSKDVRPEHNINPSASEMRDWYLKHKREKFTVAAEVGLRFLSVTFARYGRDETKGALAVARKARQDLTTGADFRTVARKVMQSSENIVGELISLGGGKEAAFPPPEEVETFAWKGEVSTVSEPLPFRRGYYMVKIEGRMAARVRPFREVQFRIREELRNQNYRQALQQLRRKLLASSYIEPELFKTRLMGSK